MKVTLAEIDGFCVGHIELTEVKSFPAHLADKLLLRLPGLKYHKCETGLVGGFILALHRGTTIGHVLEHLVIEAIGPDRVTFGQTVDGVRITIEGRFAPKDFIDALESAIAITREIGDGEHPQSESGKPGTPSDDPQC